MTTMINGHAYRQEIEGRADGIFRITETDTDGGDGEIIIYWPDAYPSRAAAEAAIVAVEEGGLNPLPSIRVDMNTGDRI